MYERKRVITDEELFDMRASKLDVFVTQTIQGLRDEVLEDLKKDGKAVKDYIFTVHQNYDPSKMEHEIKVDAKHKKELAR